MKKIALYFLIVICYLHTPCVFAQSAKIVVKQKKTNKRYKVAAGDSLIIVNYWGDVTIDNWDKEEINIDITESGKSPSASHAKEILDHLGLIEETNKKGRLCFKTRVDAVWNEGHGVNAITNADLTNPNIKIFYEAEIKFVVHAPKYLNLDIKNVSGDVTLGDVSGDLNLSVINGCFHIKNLTGANKNITLESGWGDCSVKSIEHGNLIGNNVAGSTLYISQPIDTNTVKINGWEGHQKITVR